MRWWGPLDDPVVKPPGPITPPAPVPVLPPQSDPALIRIEMLLGSILSATMTVKSQLERVKASPDLAVIAELTHVLKSTNDALAGVVAAHKPPT